MLVAEILREQERLLKVFGGVVRHDVGMEGLETGIVVPADGDVRIIGNAEALCRLLPFLHHIGNDLGIVAGNVREMNDLIMRERIKAERFHELGRYGDCTAVHARKVEGRVSPFDQLEMNAAKPLGGCFFLQCAERRRRLLNAAEAADEVCNIVEREHGLSVDAVIIFLGKIFFDPAVSDGIELLRRHGAAPNGGFGKVGGAVIPGIVRIVVCPHQVEFHLIAVVCAEEALVKALLEEGAVVIPIPVVDKDVHAVRRGLLDLAVHFLGVCLVHVAPNGLSFPAVGAVFLFVRFLHGLPLADAVWPEDAGAKLLASIGGPDIGRNIVFLHFSLSFIHCAFVFLADLFAAHNERIELLGKEKMHLFGGMIDAVCEAKSNVFLLG